MKLNRLVYVATMTYAHRYGYYPINEVFLTWKYGPVLSSIEDYYRDYDGGKDVKTYMVYASPKNSLNLQRSGDFYATYSSYGSMAIIINEVWENLKYFSAPDISGGLRDKDFALDKAFQGCKPIIDPQDVVNDSVSYARFY